jgi:hypothetical protein
LIQQSLQHRQGKGRRLAGPRLRTRSHILGAQDGWNGGCLDGRGRDVVCFAYGPKQLGGQSQFGKQHATRGEWHDHEIHGWVRLRRM